MISSCKPHQCLDKPLVECSSINMGGEIISNIDNSKNLLVDSQIDADCFAMTKKSEYNFALAVSRLRNVISKARTVPISAYNRYFTLETPSLEIDRIVPITKQL